MKILVLGCTGALGSMICEYLSNLHNTEVTGTTTRDLSKISLDGHLNYRFVTTNPVQNFSQFFDALEMHQADVVINCIGIIKQAISQATPSEVMLINAVFPHKLQAFCKEKGMRLIHISTDCVFDGDNGMYSESSKCSPTDSYGQTKLAGEVSGPNCLTLRTSFIGPAPYSVLGLFDWLCQSKASVNGFANAFFSGMTTLELAKSISVIIYEHASLSGVFNLAGKRISKHDLITKIAEAFDLDIIVNRCVEPIIDRSLDDTALREITGIPKPSWDVSLAELREFIERKNNHDI